MLRLMNHILRRQFVTWDRPSQIAFVMAIILLLVMLVIALMSPLETRATALGAAGAVFLSLQAVVLWANRGMVTPYTLAQRHYLAEDFEAARTELEQALIKTPDEVRLLTLLGNTYRQLGQLPESEATLRKALQIAPNHHFPLYGFGRTLLVMGDYANAAQTLQQALDAGAPPAIAVDLGEALYRSGNFHAAQIVLKQAQSALDNDPERKVLSEYLLYKLGVGNLPEINLIRQSAAYWQATAERFRGTPYGISLAQDVQALKQLVGEN